MLHIQLVSKINHFLIIIQTQYCQKKEDYPIFSTK